MEINSEMELFGDSPVKKKRRNKNVKRSKSRIIHVDQTAHFLGLQNSHGRCEIFLSILFEKLLWLTFALISVKLYCTDF